MPCVPLASVLVVITRVGAIVKDKVFEVETGGVAESATVTTAEKAPLAVGVPEITPVPAAIDKPAGKPVADQL